MTYSMLAIAIIATLVGIAAHIVWWQIRRPADDTLALAIVVGLGPLVMSLSATMVISCTTVPPSLSVEFLATIAAISILHGVLALIYMSCYTAAQAASPTVLIVLLAANSEQGVTKEELEKYLTDDLLSGALVHAAIDEKFVDLRNGGLHIGRRGRWLLTMGRLVRKLAGLGSPVG